MSPLRGFPATVVSCVSLILPTLALLLACGRHAGEEPERPPVTGAPEIARRLTPGACGYWETTAPESLEACGRELRSSDFTVAFPGNCGYWQVHHLDSLRRCLARLDAAGRSCALKESWTLRMTGLVSRRAEWRRCGPGVPEWRGDSVVYPVDYLLLRSDTAAADSVIWGDTNVDEPGASGLDGVRGVDLDGDGTDELYFVNRVYGTGAIFETCALGDAGGRLRCWGGPDFSLADHALRAGESFRKGWIPVQGPGRSPASVHELALGAGRSLWFFTPVYADSDANCCSSLGLSLWLEAKPVQGRFAAGLLLRAREDSSGRAVSFDTIAVR